MPFRIDEQKWADTYFNTVLAPMEDMGVDFWWLDWQQWLDSKYTKGLSNTFWLNHTFFSHARERASEGTDGLNKRPFIYHRWGGLGSHRYPLRIFRRHICHMGDSGISALVHLDGIKCQLWILGPRHRRTYVS